MREPHYSETIYIPKDKVLEAKPYLDGDTLQALEQQDGYIKGT